MKRITFFLLLTLTIFSCKKNDSDENLKICSTEFVMVGVRFMNNMGDGAETKDITVLNQRTGEKIYANTNSHIDAVRGFWVVADDGNLLSLSAEGDDLLITGTSVATGKTKSAIIKVSGGKNTCHVKKISGPEQIVFD